MHRLLRLVSACDRKNARGMGIEIPQKSFSISFPLLPFLTQGNGMNSSKLNSATSVASLDLKLGL